MLITIVKPFGFQKNLSILVHIVLVSNPVLPIWVRVFRSHVGFSQRWFRVFSTPGPGFSRVRIFFDSRPGSERHSEIGPPVMQPACNCNKCHAHTVNPCVTTCGKYYILYNKHCFIIKVNCFIINIGLFYSGIHCIRWPNLKINPILTPMISLKYLYTPATPDNFTCRRQTKTSLPLWS
jgi:hypothetical protein